MKCIVTESPLKFTLLTDVRFSQQCHITWILVSLPVIQFCMIHFKTLPCTNCTPHFQQYVVVHFYTVFLVWCLLLSAHLWHDCCYFPFSLACVTRILYKKWSLPASWTASLTVYLNFSTCTINKPFGNIFLEHVQQNFILVWFWCARCVHWQLPGRSNERKLSSTILLSSL